jgi:hypothetical protein
MAKTPLKHYREFHGVDPSFLLERRLMAPTEWTMLGTGVDVGYGIINIESSKAPHIYQHTFGAGVKIYRPREKGEKVFKHVARFPSDYMVLGDFLGCTYEVDGKQITVRGNAQTKLCVPTNRKLLCAIHVRHGVTFLFYGGKMHVANWIEN